MRAYVFGNVWLNSKLCIERRRRRRSKRRAGGAARHGVELRRRRDASVGWHLPYFSVPRCREAVP